MALNPQRLGNSILDQLSLDELNILLPASSLVSLAQSETLFRSGGEITRLLFPTTAIVGVMVTIEPDLQVECTSVGREGMVGLPAFLGCAQHPLTVVTLVPGQAVQIPADIFLRVAKQGASLDRMMRLYALYRLRFANQIGACNSLHSVQERICRWLLMAHDRVGRDEFAITHEFLAELLGVRRQTVTIVAGSMQTAGLIDYGRGVLRVVDRDRVVAASCKCYEVLKKLYIQIMGC